MFDVNHIIQSGGILLVAAIIFAESGLLIGFVLPGDTLLFAAGFIAFQGKISLLLLLIALVLAAILGFEVGYRIGDKLGPRLFKRKDGIIFREEYVLRAQEFYKKHGSKTIFLARFVPVVRTLAPLLAGIGTMSKRKFTIYNILGGTVWVVSVTVLGYWLGSKIPNIDKYLLPLVLGAVIIFGVGPTLLHLVRDKKARKLIMQKIKKLLAPQP